MEWVTSTWGSDGLQIGRFTVRLYTGSPAADLDDGHEVCEVYIPTTDRQYPDGLMIVGRRRLNTRDRLEARAMALEIALAAIAEWEGRRAA